MDASTDYQVKLEVFQGPLDLLLFLIRKKKIDIHDIPIATVTREYLKYLNQKERINLDREAEFLLIAALLIYIKSQMLLPREKPLEDEKDPRQILVNRLLDYQRIKAASSLLREKEEEELLKWKRSFLPHLLQEDAMDYIEISLFDLGESFFVLMKKKEREGIKTIKGKEYSLEEKMKEILAFLEANEFLDFLDYFSQAESFEEALVSFLGLLELIKARIVIALQESHFQPIKVWLRRKERLTNN
ncbi:MAG: segregation/condensation protein A [Candidatus Aminicenantes bacterium]|nr:segregation/condensation protein A [Candidatus Aminicenantes bacterium]MDH5465828.1 segregation/condensation protein A [Candidatus Aminicenantes bacterium]